LNRGQQNIIFHKFAYRQYVRVISFQSEAVIAKIIV